MVNPVKSGPVKSRVGQFSQAAIAFILLAYPGLALTVQGGMNGMFLLLLAASLVLLFRRRYIEPVWDSHAIAFALAMSSPVLAILFSQAFHQEFKAPAYDWAARFLFAIPIFLALREIRISTLSLLAYGIPVGALAGLALLLIHPFDWLDGRATTGQFLNLIHFSDLAVSMGLLSLISCCRLPLPRLPILILGICGFLAGSYMTIQTGERGAWLSIPLLLLILVYYQSGAHRWRNLAVSVLAMAFVAMIAYAGVGLIKQRIDLIHQDLIDFSGGHKDTSIGVRLQLWQVAIQLFMQHPIFGVGPDGFAKAMPALAAQGDISASAAIFGQGEVHSELLAKCAELGIFGLASYFAILLVPISICWKAMRLQQQPHEIRGAALMGVGLAGAFFVFGLTVEIFNLKMTAAFYALTIAVLCATAVNRSRKAN